jgi:hypothetical protein
MTDFIKDLRNLGVFVQEVATPMFVIPSEEGDTPIKVENIPFNSLDEAAEKVGEQALIVFTSAEYGDVILVRGAIIARNDAQKIIDYNEYQKSDGILGGL